MNTNFFSQLMDLGIEQVNVNIAFKEDVCTVSLLPKSNSKDKSTALNPIILTATTEQMDKEFFDEISKPLKNTAKHFSNVKTYEAELELKKSQSAEEENKKKDIKSLETELKKVVEVSDFDPHKSKSNVIKICTNLLNIDPLNSLAKKWKKEIELKTSTVSLFDEIGDGETCDCGTCELDEPEEN